MGACVHWREQSGRFAGLVASGRLPPRRWLRGLSRPLCFPFLCFNSSCSDLWSFVFDPASRRGLGPRRTLEGFLPVGFITTSQDQGRVRVRRVARKHRATAGGSQLAQRWAARERGPQPGSLYVAQTEPRRRPRGFGAPAETLASLPLFGQRATFARVLSGPRDTLPSPSSSVCCFSHFKAQAPAVVVPRSLA